MVENFFAPLFSPDLAEQTHFEQAFYSTKNRRSVHLKNVDKSFFQGWKTPYVVHILPQDIHM